MRRGMTLSLFACGAIFWGVPAAQAQYVVYTPQVVTPAVSYSYYPTTTYYQPSVTYYAPPAVSYYQPRVSYYQPTVAYAAPAVSYYQPVVSYYQPSVSYYAPAAVAPGTVTTRSYYGYGIFRPRGLYTQSTYTPGYVAPATSYYAPIIWR